MAVEKIQIKLENEQGKKVTYTAKKVKARVVFNAMKLFSNFEKEDYNEAQGVEDMLTLVADDIFRGVDEVTVDSILDGLESDELVETLNDVIAKAMGYSDEDVKEATEGK